MHTEEHARSGVVAGRVFPCTPAQVGVARRWAASVYADAGADPDVCCLLVSEVVSNAVLHSKSKTFEVRVDRQTLWIEVCDSSRALPEHHDSSERLPDGTVEPLEGGRGLELLDLLAPGWEVLLRDGGKAVRFLPMRGLR